MSTRSEPPRFSLKISIDAQGKDAIATIRRPIYTFIFALLAVLTLFAAYHIPFGSLSRLFTWVSSP